MELFYFKLDKHIESLGEKFRSKFVIKQAAYNDIILVLKDGCGKSSFKFWFHKHFKLVTLGEFQVGDLVGLKIDKVDRTNKTPKILPCKVISVQLSPDNFHIYCLCTTKCVISSRYLYK